MARNARSRAFEIPAEVANAPPRPTRNTQPRAPTVSGVALELTGQEPADLMSALIAGMTAARTEAAAHMAAGKTAEAEVSSQRAIRLEQMLVRAAAQFSAYWSR